MAARFLQGLGGGAMTVALYVLVARIYDPVDHPRIFGAFAAAWVIPSMVGPTVAGVVAETVGWRWVFLGVVGLAAAATAMLRPALRDVDRPARAVAGRVGATPAPRRGGGRRRRRGRPRRTGRRRGGVRRWQRWRSSWSCSSPPAPCSRPARCAPAAGCPRWSGCAASSRRRSSRPRSTCRTCSRSSTTSPSGCPGPHSPSALWAGRARPRSQARLGARLANATALRTGALLLVARHRPGARHRRARADALARRRGLGRRRQRHGPDVPADRHLRPRRRPPRTSRAPTPRPCRSRTPPAAPPRSR